MAFGDLCSRLRIPGNYYYDADVIAPTFKKRLEDNSLMTFILLGEGFERTSNPRLKSHS